jgi:hypothetical protein
MHCALLSITSLAVSLDDRPDIHAGDCNTYLARCW